MTIYNLFICRVLAFSELPIGKLIRKPARNLPKENFEVGVIIVLPRLPEVDILHKMCKQGPTKSHAKIFI